RLAGVLVGLNAACDIDRAGTAAAANRLRQKTARERAGRIEIGIDHSVNVVTLAAIAAKAANTDRQRRIQRQSAGDVDAAGATATANRLRNHRGAVVAIGLDLHAVRARRANRKPDGGRITARTAKSAHAKGYRTRIRILRLAKGQATRNVEAARAAAAADRLRDNAIGAARSCAGGVNFAVVALVIGDEIPIRTPGPDIARDRRRDRPR